MTVLDIKPDTSQFATKGKLDPKLAQAARAQLLTIPTPDGSGVAVHPSVMHFPTGWNGHKYWMAFTPYPSADSTKENPCIVVSEDGNTWTVPAGLTNPIEAWNGNVGQWNADTHLYMENGVMYCFWKSVEGNNEEKMYYKTSANGVNWSARVTSWTTSQSVSRPLSPSVIQEANGTYTVYCVEKLPTQHITRWTAPTLTGPWTVVDCVLNGATTTPWHADFHLIDGEYHGLIQMGGDTGGDLVAAVSTDGINFTVGPPLIERNPAAWDSVYYRSCFVPKVQGGLAGWDAWVTSAVFVASGNTLGRTFISFTSEGKQLKAQAADLKIALDNTNILAARAGIAPWVGGDTFGRADNASIGTAESGQTWTAAVGTFQIKSRAASPSVDGNTQAVIEAGVTDHWASVRIDSPAPFTAEHWVVARWQDASNFYRCGFTTGGSLVIQKIVAGSLSGIATIPLAAASKVPGVRIGLRCVGTTLYAYLNGIEVGSIVDTSLTTGTKAGMQTNKAATLYRNFTVRTS